MTSDCERTPQERIEQLETQVSEMREQFARGSNFAGTSNLSLSQYNPLVTRGAGRIIMEIPFDDSVDGSFSLDCFFQMPTQTRAIRSAKVWVQRKPFRTYNSAASGASDTAHTHNLSYTTAQAALTSGYTDTTGSSAHTTDGQGDHDHDQVGETFTGSHSHNVNSHNHGLGSHLHDYQLGSSATAGGSSHTHVITLTAGLFESGPTGTMSLFVADDGVNYGSAIVSGVTSISGQDLEPQLTKATGDKRIKIVATGLMRVQVLLMLDLRVAVIG